MILQVVDRISNRFCFVGRCRAEKIGYPTKKQGHRLGDSPLYFAGGVGSEKVMIIPETKPGTTQWHTRELYILFQHPRQLAGMSQEFRNWLVTSVYLGCGPLPVTVVNEGLQGSPTENVIILVVTVTGRGATPKVYPL